MNANIIRASVSFVVFVSLLLIVSRSQAQDLVGWQNIRWGTTYQELERMGIEGLTVKDDVYRIPKYQIFGQSFEVAFFWSKGENYLSSVKVETRSNTKRPRLVENIVGALRQKYGNPRVQKDVDKVTKIPEIGYYLDTVHLVLKWALPTTTISFDYGYVYAAHGEVLTEPGAMIKIYYTETDKDSIDKL